MIIASLLSLAIALYSYAISQLQQHGKLRWMKENNPFSFWGENSHIRKYRHHEGGRDIAPKTWYYKTFGIPFVERFPLSATILVFLTDGYHMCQWIFFNLIALSLTLAIGFNWYLLLGLLIGIRIVHWSARQILSK